MLDCNLYDNSAWIKCGLDDVDVSGQSVGMGQQIDIKSKNKTNRLFLSIEEKRLLSESEFEQIAKEVLGQS